MNMINQRVREWRAPDLATFKNEILPQNEPAVLKGLLKSWPAVQAALIIQPGALRLHQEI